MLKKNLLKVCYYTHTGAAGNMTLKMLSKTIYILSVHFDSFLRVY